MSQAETQNTTVTSTGRTGEICKKTGPYRCTTSPVVIVTVKQGTAFPEAPSTTPPHRQASTWNYVGPTTTSVPTL
jgi:hypothetical protein